MNLKNSGDSTGFEPMTSAMPVQCSNQLSYEVTQWRAGQFVGLMFSREREIVQQVRGSYLHLITNTALHITQHFFHMTLLSRENMSPTN